jgi:hypothetical protein
MTIRQLEECIDVHGKDIYGFCRQITGSAQEGEDLYQDTFMKAVEHLDKMDMERNQRISIVCCPGIMEKQAQKIRMETADCGDGQPGGEGGKRGFDF